MSEAPVLHQFPYSHFNEKARWGLAFKGVEARRKNYLPGPHEGALRRLSGQTATPVLALDGDVVVGSAAILAALEERYPDPPLLPDDPAQRRDALALQERWDHEVGPAARSATFSVMLDEPGYVARTFGSPHPLPVRLLYRAVLPLARGKVRRAYRTDDREYVEACRRTVDAALEEIVRRSEATGYLVGDRFSVADLTAAALLAPLANPDHVDMRRPEPQPPRVVEFVRDWHRHPGADWVREMYRRHR